MGDRNYKYELDHIRKILMDTCAGMIYLHENNIIHRDLKPGNLLLTQDWKTKVADFGLSRALPNANVTRTLTSCGTITYTAPEVLRDQRYSLKVDIWSFGIIALSLITRTKPYPKMTDAQIVIRVLAGKRPNIPPKVPKEFTNLIKKCLKNDPKERPSFQQLSRILEQISVPKPQYDTPINHHENPIPRSSLRKTPSTEDTPRPQNWVGSPIMRIPSGTIISNNKDNLTTGDSGSYSIHSGESVPDNFVGSPVNNTPDNLPTIFNETSSKRDKVRRGAEQEMVMFSSLKVPTDTETELNSETIIDEPDNLLTLGQSPPITDVPTAQPFLSAIDPFQTINTAVEIK